MTAVSGDASAETWWSLRPATLTDVGRLALAELQLFPEEAWTAFQLAAELEHPSRRYVVAVAASDASGPTAFAGTEQGAVVGYAGIMLAGDAADLHTIGTTRPGKGIGRSLLAWCEDQARDGGAERMLLEVREDNDRARAFYQRAGYAEIDRRRGYYRHPQGNVDAIVMQKPLAA